MKKFLIGILAMAFAGSVMAAGVQNLSVPEMTQWDADTCVTVNYKDFSKFTGSNTTYTMTNVLAIAAGNTLELRAFVLDKAFAGATHTNTYTNSLTVAVVDAGSTNSIMAATQIHAEGTEVWFKLPYVLSTLTYLTTGATTTTAVVVTSPAGNKYYTAANYVNLDFATGAEHIMSADTAGSFRLYFRTHKLND